MKSRFSYVLVSAVIGALLIAAPGLTAQPQDPQQPSDNTKSNKGDSAKGALTADQQKMNSADQEITKKIRSAIMKDKSLSTYAHNIKIITQDGKVTLKGPVRTTKKRAAWKLEPQS